MKIALVYSDDFSIWHFRKGLIKALLEKDIEVYAISTAGKYVELIESLGAVHIPIKMDRFVNPIKDLKFLIALYNIFRVHKFDIVHNFTIKPNIYGAIAARLAGIKRVINSVTGLGYVFSDTPGLKLKVLRYIVKRLYWLSCKLSNNVWFQNNDDLTFFVKSNLISKTKAVLIKSSGVPLEEFTPDSFDRDKVAILKKELGIDDSTKFVTMVGRKIWSKGIKEFIEASKEVKKKYPSVKFLSIGEREEDNPSSVPESYLREEASKNFQWLGFRKDIKEIFALSDIVVLPSYYNEGVPRGLLEAMAMGKPIITTDTVGCREVVEIDKNGYLVPVRKSKALADAIEALVNDGKKRIEFGRYSRLKVEREFDETIVVERIIKELYQL